MSFTSFNPIQIQPTATPRNQPIMLKQGQVLQGTVKKLYPDQLAEIQVGGHKFLAKLETPLKAGDSHFLQVTSISPQTELKVVTGPMSASSSMKQQVHQLLGTMNLPITTSMVQLVSHLLKEQVPISKDLIQQAHNLLNNKLPTQEALESIQKILESKLPLTKEVFNAFIQGSKTSGMLHSIETFSQLLAKDQSIATDTQKAIMANLESISKPLDTMKGGYIVSKAVQSLVNESEPIATKLYALNILKEASILPKQATLSNWTETLSNQLKNSTENVAVNYAGNTIQTIQKMNDQNASHLMNQVKLWAQNEPNLTESQKSEFLTLLNRYETTPKNAQNVEQFAKQIHEWMLKAYSNRITNQSFTKNTNEPNGIGQLLSLLGKDPTLSESQLLSNVTKIVTESSQPQIQSLNQQVDQQLKTTLDGYTVQHALKNVLKSLGVSYEIALSKNLEEVEQVADRLKPNVLSLLKEGVLSPVLKDAAEVLLARMNGMQLLSGENGHQHQMVMQVPLQLFGKSMDATLQWNGKMNEDGKIDSNYARILFYLDMESLKETVVDMQVQNRIITINLFNENNNLQPIADAYQEILKNRLTEQGYYLSGIFFKNFGKDTFASTVKNVSKEEEARTNGVDIRI